MSAFSSLFSGAPKDDNVESLFGHSAGPVDRDSLKSSRTVIEVPEEPEQKVKPRKEKSEKKQRKKSKKSNDGEEDLEAKYYSKLLDEEEKANSKAESEKEASDDKELETSPEAESKDENEEEGSDAESSEDEEATKKTKTTAAKTVDLKEEELDKAERTVFVGNVPTTVITNKKTYKNFKKQFQQVGSVQAIRFRSIAFDEALPRKLAFAKKALHSLRDTVNAYVVFKEREPSRKVCGRLNATLFEHHHLRVDHVAHPAPKDNKRTIFVGNLDFEEQEENLWRYFNKHTGDDVESVRVVRDSKTNLGKGFALVQFKDTLSVNKALMLNDKPMIVPDASEPAEGDKKKKPRKLRISRAKANAKPSILSPNHVDNARKLKKPKARLTDEQKTKLGRARTLLGKSDRNTAGSVIIEGARASKGQKIAGIKGLKSAKGKVKKPRITDRSTRFKKDKQAMTKLGNKK